MRGGERKKKKSLQSRRPYAALAQTHRGHAMNATVRSRGRRGGEVGTCGPAESRKAVSRVRSGPWGSDRRPDRRGGSTAVSFRVRLGPGVMDLAIQRPDNYRTEGSN